MNLAKNFRLSAPVTFVPDVTSLSARKETVEQFAHIVTNAGRNFVTRLPGTDSKVLSEIHSRIFNA